MSTLVLLDRLSVGGAERHAAQLARLLPQFGQPAHLAAYMGVVAANFPRTELPSDVSMINQSSIFRPSGWRALRRIIKDRNIDLVLAVNQTALVLAILTRILGFHHARVVCIFHTTIIKSWSGRIKLPVFYLSVLCCDGLVFVSRNQCKYWTGRGLPARRVFTIQNGVDTVTFSPPTRVEKAEARRALGLPLDAFIVSLTGRFAPEKNQRQIIEAAAELRALGRNLRVLLIGGGPLRGEAEQIARELAVDESVIFCGEHGDVRPYLRASDACVLTSIAVETFSLAALEGMAMALPSILSDIGGASEIVEPEKTGFLFPPNDTGALVGRILDIMRPGAAQKMGQAARLRVLENFNIDRMLSGYAKCVELIRGLNISTAHEV